MTIEERNRHIRKAYEDGMPVQEIADRAGISRGRVQAILTDLGVKKGRRGRPVHLEITWKQG